MTMENGKSVSSPTEVTKVAQTPVGILPLEEIRAAGFEWDSRLEQVMDWSEGKMVLKPRGFNTIPSETYYSQGESDGSEAGIKYTAPSQRYLAWRSDYIARNKKAVLTQKVVVQDPIPKLETTTVEDIIDIKDLQF